MTPQQPAPRTKAFLALVLLVLLGAVCIGAGQWQLRRAHERETLQAAIEAGRRAPALTLDAQHRDGPDWHPANARGHWLNPFTVLLDNRNLKGQPGLWVATPLELQDSPGTAVLVLRGWIARPMPPAGLPDLDAEAGLVQVEGTLLHRVPRLFDLGSLTGPADTALPRPFPTGDGQPPRVQNLPLEALETATGLSLLPVVLQQAPTRDSGLIQDWPGPSTDAGQNYNYALQWFSFAAIALIAACITAWRILRRPSPASHA
ncbi:SURF1 family protein [Castellaniella ginsengisoli]|uniref:SURF1-like protein n=1 Tax=Castellaniella ginsengisoli TaxID=546114 RepID=A0AB39DIQ1_9BURK